MRMRVRIVTYPRLTTNLCFSEAEILALQVKFDAEILKKNNLKDVSTQVNLIVSKKNQSKLFFIFHQQIKNVSINQQSLIK